jgi:antitoxin (DNA-binding transcriptional repressor) of toxin-antitoxin stability system
MSSLPKVISLKEFRITMPKVMEAISAGQSFTVVKRSKPVFQISPVEDEGEWTTIIDFTEISPGGVDAEEVLKALAKV